MVRVIEYINDKKFIQDTKSERQWRVLKREERKRPKQRKEKKEKRNRTGRVKDSRVFV